MSTLTPAHLKEWQASAVSAEVIAANNIRSIDGEEFETLILVEALEKAVDATGGYATTDAYKLRKRHAESITHGGWYAAGIDFSPLRQQHQVWLDSGKNDDNSWAAIADSVDGLAVSTWGCFKPDAPRISKWRKTRDGQWEQHEGKVVKYEHPAGVATGVFAFNYPKNPRLWLDVLANGETPIVIVEGAKKAACLTSLGIVAIGIPGVDQWNRPGTRELIDELAIFARKGRTFLIAFDQDTAAKTVRNVNASKYRLANALKRQGSKVKIVSWDKVLGKGLDDVIEAHGRGPIDKAIATAPSFEYWAHKRISGLSLKADWVCPANQRYLNGVPFPENFKWAVLKGPKGVGKTEEMKAVVAIAKAEGRPVLFISHRKMLTSALCHRTDLPTIYEVIEGAGEGNGYGLCIQSLHPDSQAQFEAHYWGNALVIIDECEQVFWELLQSSTCKANRVPILRQLKALVANVLSPHSKGQLLMADADVSDVAIKFVEGMATTHGGTAPKPWVALSEYKGTAYDVRSFEKKEELWLETKAALTAGQKLLICTDSQKVGARFGTIGIADAIKAAFPDLRVGRIDSETLSREDSPMYGALGHINEIAKGYDVLIVSPSIETGVSLDIKGHFDRVIGFFQGVLSENSVRQFMARLRDNVPRDIYVAPIGLNSIGGCELSPEEFTASLDRQAASTLAVIYDAARDDIAANLDFCVEGTIALAQWACRQNAGMAAYREIIHGGLIDEGHTVTAVKRSADLKEICTETSNELSVRKQKRLHSHGEALAKADDLTDAQSAAMEKRNSTKNEAEALALEKATLKRMHPGVEVGPDLYIVSDKGKWHSKLKLHYALTVGREFTKATDKAKVDALIDGDAVWGLDVKRSTLSMKVAMLEFFNIPALLTRESIRQDDAAIAALAEKALTNSRMVKKILGFNVSGQESPAVTARKFLKAVGFGFGKASRQRDGAGGVLRTYPIERIDYKTLGGIVDGEFDAKAFRYECDRAPIFEAWITRDKADEVKATLEPLESAGMTSAKGVEPDSEGDEVGHRLYKVIYLETKRCHTSPEIKDTETKRCHTSPEIKDALAIPPHETMKCEGVSPLTPNFDTEYRWGTSCSAWTITHLDGEIATIVNRFGNILTAPMAELTPLDPMAIV